MFGYRSDSVRIVWKYCSREETRSVGTGCAEHRRRDVVAIPIHIELRVNEYDKDNKNRNR